MDLFSASREPPKGGNGKDFGVSPIPETPELSPGYDFQPSKAICQWKRHIFKTFVTH